MKTPAFQLVLFLGSALASPAAAADSSRETSLAFFSSGATTLSEGSRRVGRFGGSHVRFNHETSIPLGAQSALIAGVALDAFSFDSPANEIVPARLGSTALRVGWQRQLDPRWTFRAEALPGAYGDTTVGLRGDSFNAPLSIRVVRASSADLQWAFGIDVDARSGHPIVGGLGVRWKFAPAWTLVALPPAPRVEFAASSNVTLFAGGELVRGTYRVASDFGRTRGRPTLDAQNVDYRETRVQVGARWRFSPAVELTVAVGCLADRRFAFDDRNLLVHGGGASAASVAVTGRY